MKKTAELLQAMTAKRKEVVDLKAAGKLEEAAKAAVELTNLKAEYDTEAALEMTAAGGNKAPIKATMATHKDLRRAFNKTVLAQAGVSFTAMTPAENEAAKKIKMAAEGQNGATGTKGGYLIPQEFIAPIAEARGELIALKELCSIKMVSRLTGVMPKAAVENGKLVAFDENTAINKDTIDFGQVPFTVKSYGDIIPVSNELLADADVDLVGFINSRFAKKAVNTENADIVALMDTLTETAITDYKGIIKALNTSLDPAVAADAVIITNQDGYNYLDSLTDDNGRPLLTMSFADFKTVTFRGHKIVYLNNETIKTTAGKIPFYVGSLADFAYFFDRSGVELAADASAGFTSNTTYLRAIERYDVAKVDENAMVKLVLSE